MLRSDTLWHKRRPRLSVVLFSTAAVLGACGQTSNDPKQAGSTSGTGGTGGSGAGTGGSGAGTGGTSGTASGGASGTASGGASGTASGGALGSGSGGALGSGSGGASGSGSGADGGAGGIPGMCPGTGAAIPAKDPLPAPRAAAGVCGQPGTPIDVLDRNAAPRELTGTWVCCANSPAPLDPQWTPKPCELFGKAHDAIEFTGDGKLRLLAFEGDQLRPVAGAATGEWSVGGGTPEQGGITCPLFLRLSNGSSLEEMNFRFTRSPTKLWLSSQLSPGGPHYAGTTP